ncbi:MAG: hypothetical protein WAK91_14625 [Candidatus Acidiferrales bacterium]|jgi:hypothetical protein
MFFFKFGLLTCAFYAALTLSLEAGMWALTNHHGWMFFVDKRHPALSIAVVPAILFGFLWIVSFGAAWFIVYRDLKLIFPFLIK